MFFSKFIVVVFLFLFSISIFGMDFSDDGGMNFDDTPKVQTHKKKKSSKKKHHRKKKKNKKKKVVKKAPEKDTGMTFGEETTTEAKEEKKENSITKGPKETKSDSGMNFGDEDSGMNFGDEDAGMVFGDEDAKEDGKIDQKEMNFDMAEIEKDVKSKKEDKVKITKKRNTYVVKGLYFKLATGTTYLLSPKLAEKIEPNQKSLFGFNTHLTLGYDLNTALSLEMYGEFIFNQAQIKGSSNILYSRDFNSRTIGLGVNFNVLNSERTNLHLNLHGGLLMIDPSLGFDGLKVSAGGLVGFEYYLLLKHFSTSIFVSSDYMTGYDTMSISLSASLKYSF